MSIAPLGAGRRPASYRAGMPKSGASELTPEQLADAKRLRNLFDAWQAAGKKSKGHRRTQQHLATRYFRHSTAGTVWQYLHGHRPLNEDAVHLFAQAFGCSLADISPSLARSFNSKVAATRIGSKVRDSGSRREPYIVQTSPTKAEIRGVATMSQSGTWQWTDMLPGEGSVPWNRPGCYALRVIGDAMHPRYKSGEYLIVREDAPIEADTDVLVVLKDGTAMVRELASKRDGHVALRELTGARLTVDEARIEIIHRVVGRSDASEVEPA